MFFFYIKHMETLKLILIFVFLQETVKKKKI